MLDIQAYDVNAVLVGEASFVMDVYNPPTAEALTFVGQPPIINNFSPMTGSTGNLVTINGNGFSTTPSQNTVTICGVSAVVQSSASMSMQVLVPQGIASPVVVAPGQIAVTVSTQTGQSRGSFTPVTESTTLNTYSLAPNTGAEGIAFDTSGNAYVTNHTSSMVTELSPTGVILNTFSVGSNPIGIARDQTGNFWVANSGNNKISEILAGGGVSTFTPAGLNTPRNVAVDTTNHIWITNYATAATTVLELNSNGTLNTTYTVGTQPDGIAIDATGDAWVADYNGGGAPGNAHEITAGGVVNGPYLAASGPKGVAVDSNGKIWVADQAAGKVTVFNSNGSKLAETPGFTNPYYITFDLLGNAWITQFTSNTVAKVSLSGSTLTIQGTYPAAGNPFAIATNPKDGNIWVTNDASSTVTVIAP